MLCDVTRKLFFKFFQLFIVKRKWYLLVLNATNIHNIFYRILCVFAKSQIVRWYARKFCVDYYASYMVLWNQDRYAVKGYYFCLTYLSSGLNWCKDKFCCMDVHSFHHGFLIIVRAVEGYVYFLGVLTRIGHDGIKIRFELTKCSHFIFYFFISPESIWGKGGGGGLYMLYPRRWLPDLI